MRKSAVVNGSRADCRRTQETLRRSPRHQLKCRRILRGFGEFSRRPKCPATKFLVRKFLGICALFAAFRSQKKLPSGISPPGTSDPGGCFLGYTNGEIGVSQLDATCLPTESGIRSALVLQRPRGFKKENRQKKSEDGDEKKKKKKTGEAQGGSDAPAGFGCLGEGRARIARFSFPSASPLVAANL